MQEGRLMTRANNLCRTREGCLNACSLQSEVNASSEDDKATETSCLSVMLHPRTNIGLVLIILLNSKISSKE
uniref:Uncharacterized protein n=2 Tax=Mus TaxID=862507 RepID=Q3V3G4_MOUSE|nr:unnamed protein product [Mus musculus]